MVPELGNMVAIFKGLFSIISVILSEEIASEQLTGRFIQKTLQTGICVRVVPNIIVAKLRMVTKIFSHHEIWTCSETGDFELD